MYMRDDKLILHTTSIGSCARKEMLQFSGEQPTDPVNFYAQLGTFVHGMLEHCLRKYAKVGVLSNIQDAFESMQLGDEGFGEEWRAEIMEKAERGWSWLRSEEEAEHLNIVEVENRHMLQYTVDDEPVLIDGHEVWVTGTPDLIINYDDTDYIIDFKSGKTRNKKQSWQVSAYNLMRYMNFHGDPAKARIVYLGIEPKVKVQKNGKVHKYHERELTLEEVVEYGKEWYHALEEYIEEIKECYPNIPQHDDCEACFFCPYRTLDWGEEYQRGG